MNPNTKYGNTRRTLAFTLMDVRAVLTYESTDPDNPQLPHPLIVERGTERGFKLKLHEKNPEAPLSPFYFNLRTPDNPKPGPLTPEIIKIAASCMQRVQLDAKLAFNATVGVPRAGDPFAQALAGFAGVPCLPMDKYEHGDKRCIAGLKGRIPVEVQKVLMVDDLVTEGHSKLEAIHILRDAGLEVSDVMVLIDHGRGGREELEKLGCKLHSVFTAAKLLDLYSHFGKVKPRIRDDIQKYIASQV